MVSDIDAGFWEAIVSVERGLTYIKILGFQLLPFHVRRLNELLSMARTFVFLESIECPVSWQCS